MMPATRGAALLQHTRALPAWLRRTAWRRWPARAPARWLQVRAVDPGFPEADSAYHAVHAGGDGRIYFTLSTHRPDAHGRLGCVDPADGRVAFVRDVGGALDDSLGLPGQGKIHVPLGEAAGALYFAAPAGFYRGPHGARTLPSFHILRFDVTSNRLTSLARGPAGEGLITGLLDAERLVYYGLTYPSGLFCRYDIRRDELHVGPPPRVERALPHRVLDRPAYPVCRSLGVDGDGAVYGSCLDGAIWRCPPNGAPQVVPEVNVREGAVPPIDALGDADRFWRVVRWDGGERCFYGIHAGTQSLFRFDPRGRRVEALSRFGAAALHEAGSAPFRSQLGLVQVGRALVHIAHGPPAHVPGGPDARRTAYLVRYDLDRGCFEELGALRTTDGERVLFAESLDADARGNLYSMACIEVTDPDLRPHVARLRAESSAAECRGEVYRMMLVRIDASVLRGTP